MKTALVTGANRGIGKEVARQLADRGFHVFVGARNLQAGKEVAAQISANGHKATPLLLDVADQESVLAAARDLAQETDGVLDVLINNAGRIVDGDDAILQLTDEMLRETFETNTLGPLRVTRAFQPLLAQSQSPRVINVSSGGGQLADGADGWAPAYCISKTALNGVTSQLAAALPKFSINSVCPGWVRTDMGGANATRSLEEGADTIVWLATEAPAKITGQFLRDRKNLPW